MNDKDSASELVPSQRRLQRPPDFTGKRLDTFSQVFLRHGLPGAALGALFLLLPEARDLCARALAPVRDDPAGYALGGLGVLAGLVVYAWFLDRRLDARQAGWILYLLFLSSWEEWVFRLAIPYSAGAGGLHFIAIVLVSNAVFGAMHYFTLRWKWQWCVGAFLGGLALSRQLMHDFDLLLVVALHWMATFANTPRVPGRSRVR